MNSGIAPISEIVRAAVTLFNEMSVGDKSKFMFACLRAADQEIVFEVTDEMHRIADYNPDRQSRTYEIYPSRLVDNTKVSTAAKGYVPR